MAIARVTVERRVMPAACGPHDPGEYPDAPFGSQPAGAQGVARLVRSVNYGLRRATPWIAARICDQMGYLSVTAGTSSLTTRIHVSHQPR